MDNNKNLLLMLAQRSWQGLSGLFTLILITGYLTPTYQGWYYTFATLSALFYIFDLGLSNVIIHTSSHFFADLKWQQDGKVTGNKSLVFYSFLSQSINKYLYLSLFFCSLTIPFGIIFFQYANSIHLIKIENWLFPWIVLIVLSSLNAILSPYLSIVEGSGKLKEILWIRLYSSIIGCIGCWYLLTNNGNLWSLITLPLATLMFSFFWLLQNKRSLIVKKNKDSGLFKWKNEILPFQWQVGLTSLSAYLSSQIFIPVLFYIDGAKIAGQTGVSLTIANMLCLLAQSWVTYQIPELGQAAAKKEWAKLNKAFNKSLIYSAAFYLISSSALFIFFLFFMPAEYTSRMLPKWPFIGILASVFLNHIVWIFSSHIRSFKKEPFALISLVSILITFPLAVFGTYKYSVNGTIICIIFVQLFFSVPASIYIWNNFKTSFKKIIL
jgi:O-antigen/teichoic acid export membrane protein